MPTTAKRGAATSRVPRAAVPLLLLALIAAMAALAAAAPAAEVIVFRGDIFLGNLQRGTAERFIDAPAGRMAVGMAADIAYHLLFVAGGFTGRPTSTTCALGPRSPATSSPLRPPRWSTTRPSPKTAAGSPTLSSPGSTSCRSAGPGSRRQRSAR